MALNKKATKQKLMNQVEVREIGKLLFKQDWHANLIGHFANNGDWSELESKYKSAYLKDAVNIISKLDTLRLPNESR